MSRSSADVVADKRRAGNVIFGEPVSISPTFYAKILRAQIQKAQKIKKYSQVVSPGIFASKSFV
jgi:hypothetical protein